MLEKQVIKEITLIHSKIPFKDIGSNFSFGFTPIYQPGSIGHKTVLGIQISTNTGLQGEYLSVAPSTFEQAQMIAPILIGQNPLEREHFYNQAKAILRKTDRMGIGPIDIALWDLAGKVFNTSITKLLGGYKKKLPAYASTYSADEAPDGLNSPEAYADFAQQCLEIGYKGFKIHGWTNGTIENDIKTMQTVRKKIGDKMQLMLDPMCAYNTFSQALTVGKVCDQENFFWYEDPLRDGGTSHNAYKQLRKKIKTPLLQGEHLHLVEAHVDIAIAQATDIFRADPEYDGGITGVMKIAHAAEAMGMDVELHPAGPAQRHCMAAIRNTNFYEMAMIHPKLPHNSSSPPLYLCDYSDELKSVDKNGNVLVPTGPGLGVLYDWKTIEKHSFQKIKFNTIQTTAMTW